MTVEGQLRNKVEQLESEVQALRLAQRRLLEYVMAARNIAFAKRETQQIALMLDRIWGEPLDELTSGQKITNDEEEGNEL